jgi:hypothetical protein
MAHWEKAKVVPRNRKTPTPTSRRIVFVDRHYWVSNEEGVKVSRFLENYHLRDRDVGSVYAYEDLGITILKSNGQEGVIIDIRGTSLDDMTRDVAKLEQDSGVKLVELHDLDK